MEDNSSNPNIEWKKPGFGSSEKLSLKVNTKEAVLYDAKKKNGLQKSNPLTPADLPAGLKKIRKKIKDVFDEDEEDENDSVFVPSQRHCIRLKCKMTPASWRLWQWPTKRHRKPD